LVGLSEITVLQGGHSSSLERHVLSDLLQARTPVVYFSTLIGDSILTLPALRALAEMFSAPLTLICPKVAFDLCFREVSPHYVDITGVAPGGPPIGAHAHRTLDYEALESEIGAIDLFINAVPWDIPSNGFIRRLWRRLAPTTSIGFPTDDDYDIVVPRDLPHSADLTFKLARLFDPSLRIDNYAQPLLLQPAVQQQARSIRAAVPAGVKVLVVHADAGWTEKRWPATRFIDLLDRFLSRHRDFVAWVVGMGHEELNVGRERDRVFPHLGLPLDLAMGLVANADLFVGIDSSMLHAADLARVPGVGLFGRTRSAMWGFRFAPHRHIDMTVMEDITVEDVLDAMEDLVADRPDRGEDIDAMRVGIHTGALRHSTKTDLLPAVRQFYDVARLWHRDEPDDASASGSITERALHLHALNFALWHHEDAIRRPGVDDHEVARRKRCIDDLNGRRNAAIEDIDATLLESVDLNPNAPPHTETPATIVDRLSVLALRILHTNRTEQPSARLEVLEEQYDNLFGGLEQLLTRMQAGEIGFKLYRQFKSAPQRSYCDLFESRDT
jgi:ADP-heptose:LPS heptosyltransferase